MLIINDISCCILGKECRFYTAAFVIQIIIPRQVQAKIANIFMNNAELHLSCDCLSMKIFTSSGKWMSFLLNNACWLSEGKGFVDLYILWLFLPPPTTLSKGCFVSWLVCFVFFFCFGIFWLVLVLFVCFLLNLGCLFCSVSFLCYLLDGPPYIHHCWFLCISSGSGTFSLMQRHTVLKQRDCLYGMKAAYYLYPWIPALGMRGRKIPENLFKTHKQLQSKASSHQFWSQINLCHEAEELQCHAVPQSLTLAKAVHGLMSCSETEAGNFRNPPCPMQ